LRKAAAGYGEGVPVVGVYLVVIGVLMFGGGAFILARRKPLVEGDKRAGRFADPTKYVVLGVFDTILGLAVTALGVVFLLGWASERLREGGGG
jgi:hypothetical protein